MLGGYFSCHKAGIARLISKANKARGRGGGKKKKNPIHVLKTQFSGFSGGLSKFLLSYLTLPYESGKHKNNRIQGMNQCCVWPFIHALFTNASFIHSHS